MLFHICSWSLQDVPNVADCFSEREGLFEIIARTKNPYQKRAYQCIKCIVTLFSTCHAANEMFNNSLELRVSSYVNKVISVLLNLYFNNDICAAVNKLEAS